MKTFHVSVQQNGKIFRYLDKIPFDLNTASNIAGQAIVFISSILSSMGIIYSEDEFAWKVYSYNGREFWFVSKSRNWVGD